jgi:hypothetical protein
MPPSEFRTLHRSLFSARPDQPCSLHSSRFESKPQARRRRQIGFQASCQRVGPPTPGQGAEVLRTAPRLGREWNLLPPSCGDLPVGQFVSSPVCKNISVSTHPKSLLELSPSHSTEGRIAIVTDAGRDAVDAAAFCARRDCRAGCYGSVSGQQRADERCCSVRRSRVVLTPRRWRQVCGCLSRPYRVQTKR